MIKLNLFNWKVIAKIVLLNLYFSIPLRAQSEFTGAYQKLAVLIETEKAFKYAVFIVENTFDSTLNYTSYQREINLLADIAIVKQKQDSLSYKGKDYAIIHTYGSIFRTLTDTTRLLLGGKKYIHFPFHYDFGDVFGEKKWENMFVTKLLKTRKGNCHSMPYLYKILCEELGVPCHLALAPNHLYVKHRSEKAGWYNTELTSASFPMDAWLMASGYISLQAIQNGIYMDALDDKQCIALCVLDLAKGFDRKYPDNDGTFIVKCCDLTLAYFPKCINAMLFKAETRKKQLERLSKKRNIQNPAVLQLQLGGQELWEEMNRLYTQIHRLGYRTMPEPMYVDWLVSLQKEREKYANKQIMESPK
jgi:hypothetical protein